MSIIDLTGKVYGELKVLSFSHVADNPKSAVWNCRCSCGVEKKIYGYSLINGHYKSCGCRRIENRDAGVKKHIENDRVSGTRISALKAKLHAGNKSGVKGVMWLPKKNKWRAYIGFQGKQISLGHYDNLSDAVKARKDGEEKYHKPLLIENGELKKERKLIDLTGKKYGRLTVICESERKDNRRQWLCQCSCGETAIVSMGNLTNKNRPTRSCGCLQKETAGKSGVVDFSGLRFGKLTVLERIENKKGVAVTRWLCECDCGNRRIVYKAQLTNGEATSCGCLFGKTTNNKWTDEEDAKLLELRNSGLTYVEISKRIDRTPAACRVRLTKLIKDK